MPSVMGNRLSMPARYGKPARCDLKVAQWP